MSREQYGLGDASTLPSDSIRRSVAGKANAAFLAQVAPTSPAVTPPAGLLHLGATDGGALTIDIDGLTDAIAGIEAANGTATTIVAAPDAWATLSKMKVGADFNSTLLGSGTLATQRMLAGLPVYVSPSVLSGKLLVIDKSAVLIAVGQVMLAVSDQIYFASDSLGIRCTFRFGQKLVNTARVVSLTVTGT